MSTPTADVIRYFRSGDHDTVIYATGYIAGLFGTEVEMEIQNHWYNKKYKFFFCRGVSPDVRTAFDILAGYVAIHPSKASEGWERTMIAALLEAFPCKE